jgi:hypothetical protein
LGADGPLRLVPSRRIEGTTEGKAKKEGLLVQPTELQTRIRTCRVEADSLTAQLAELADRADAARRARDETGAELWDRRFAEAASRFMACVELILDDCWALQGRKRVRQADQPVSEAEIEWVEATVARICGLPVGLSSASATPGAILVAPDLPPLPSDPASPSAAPKRSDSRIDVTG